MRQTLDLLDGTKPRPCRQMDQSQVVLAADDVGEFSFDGDSGVEDANVSLETLYETAYQLIRHFKH